MPAIDAFTRSIEEAVKPDRRSTISEWAEEHRVLPIDTPEPGPWRNSRTPYLVDIQDTMSPGRGYVEGWVKKGHQLGGSSVGENFIGHAICEAAGSLMVVFPTLDDAEKWELSRFEPMRKATRALRRRIRSSQIKGADNTKKRKRYPGGFMQLIGSNRAGAAKSSTIRYVKFEEPDEYPSDLQDQGSTIDLVKKRTSNFGKKARIFGDGTPTIDGSSEIDKQYKRGDQRKWFVHCPECGEAQHFVWKQMKWIDDDPETAQYACVHCGVLSPEHVWKTRGYEGAHWRATAVGEPAVASWHLPALVAPLGWRPWTACAAEWIAAQGDEEKLKVFYNNTLAECWKDTVHSEISAEALQQRAENYPLMVLPAGALIAVAGVDTQDNRLAIVINGYGRGEESWRIFHGEIYGNPSSPDVWQKLRELLDAPIRHASGQVLRGVDAAAIDSGGHHTEDVYAFTRDAQLRGKAWFAIKGAKPIDAPKLGKPKTVEFNWRGRPVPGGATIRHIGTQAIKNLLASRLHEFKRPGAGYWHFPLGLNADYYQQLLAERREWRRDSSGRKMLWWVKGSGRNEAWDCEVYAYAALLYAMSGRHAEVVFRERERIFGTTQRDMFDATPAPSDEAPQESPQTSIEVENSPIAVPPIFGRRGGRRVRSSGIQR